MRLYARRAEWSFPFIGFGRAIFRPFVLIDERDLALVDLHAAQAALLESSIQIQAPEILLVTNQETGATRSVFRFADKGQRAAALLALGELAGLGWFSEGAK